MPNVLKGIVMLNNKCYILLEIQQPVHLRTDHTIWKTVSRYISLPKPSELH